MRIYNGSAYRVLLLLDLKHGAVLERPLDNIRLIRSSLDKLALLKLGPELAEVLEFDQVPDIAERRLDDGRLADRGGCGNASRHGEVGGTIGFIDAGWAGIKMNWAELALVVVSREEV